MNGGIETAGGAGGPRGFGGWRRAVFLAGTLASGLALASGPVAISAQSPRGADAREDAPTVAARGPGSSALEIPLHLSAHSFVELQSRTVGAELGASYAVSPFTDLGLSAVLGQSVGGRATLSLHPGPDWRLKPVAQLRGVVQPVGSGLALGGGLALGATLDLGPGRVSALAVGEAFQGPPGSLATGLFAMLGYEVDFFHPRAQGARAPASAPPAPAPAPSAEPKPAPPAEPAPAPPPKVELRTDDLPPPMFPRARAEPPAPAPAVEQEPPRPPPPAGQSRVSVKLRISDRVYFADGRTWMRSRYLPVLKHVASLLGRFPAIRKVRIDGYANDTGSDQVNLQLAEWRAREVLRYLVKNGVDASRVEMRAVGRLPAFPRSKQREAEENRRVEFTIVDPPQDDG